MSFIFVTLGLFCFVFNLTVWILIPRPGIPHHNICNCILQIPVVLPFCILSVSLVLFMLSCEEQGLCVFVEGGVVCTLITGLQSDGDIAESCVVPPSALGCPSPITDTIFRGWPQWTSKVRLGKCWHGILTVVMWNLNWAELCLQSMSKTWTWANRTEHFALSLLQVLVVLTNAVFWIKFTTGCTILISFLYPFLGTTIIHQHFKVELKHVWS